MAGTIDTGKVTVKYVDGDNYITVKVRCDSPYYARVLAEDIADRLNRDEPVTIKFGNQPVVNQTSR